MRTKCDLDLQTQLLINAVKNTALEDIREFIHVADPTALYDEDGARCSAFTLAIRSGNDAIRTIFLRFLKKFNLAGERGYWILKAANDMYDEKSLSALKEVYPDIIFLAPNGIGTKDSSDIGDSALMSLTALKNSKGLSMLHSTSEVESEEEEEEEKEEASEEFDCSEEDQVDAPEEVDDIDEEDLGAAKKREKINAFLTAIKNNDEDKVSELLDDGFDAAEIFNTEESGLTRAFNLNKGGIIKIITDRPLDLSGERGYWALKAALESNYYSFDLIKKLILSYKENINFIPTVSRMMDFSTSEIRFVPHTLLRIALNKPNNGAIIDELIKNGAQIGLSNLHEELLLSIRNGYEKIFLYKIAFREDMGFKGIKEHELLKAAVEVGNRSIVEKLITLDVPIDLSDSAIENCPLMIAIKYGYSNIVKQLLNQGALLFREGQSQAFFFAAIKNDHLEIISDLFEAGLKINIPLEEQLSSFSKLDLVESKEPYQKTAAFLFEREKGTEITQIAHSQILAIAIQKRYPHIRELVLTSKFNLKNQKDKGYAALKAAIDSNDLEMAKALVAAGADVNFSVNKSHLINAIDRKLEGLVDFLLENGANPNQFHAEYPRSALMKAILLGDLSVIEKLLKKNAVLGDLSMIEKLLPQKSFLIPENFPIIDLKIVNLLLEYNFMLTANDRLFKILCTSEGAFRSSKKLKTKIADLLILSTIDGSERTLTYLNNLLTMLNAHKTHSDKLITKQLFFLNRVQIKEDDSTYKYLLKINISGKNLKMLLDDCYPEELENFVINLKKYTHITITTVSAEDKLTDIQAEKWKTITLALRHHETSLVEKIDDKARPSCSFDYRNTYKREFNRLFPAAQKEILVIHLLKRRGGLFSLLPKEITDYICSDVGLNRPRFK